MKISMEGHELRRRYGDKKMIAMLKEAGFDAVDYTLYSTQDDLRILLSEGQEYIAHAKEVRAMLDEAGMVCNQAHAETGMRDYFAYDPSNKKYLEVVRCIEIAGILGAKQLVVHGVGDPLHYDEEKMIQCNVKYYKSLIPYCQQNNVRVAVENLAAMDPASQRYRSFIGTSDVHSRVVTECNSPWIVGCMDIGHAALFQDPVDFIKRSAPGVIQALHVQDMDYVDDRHMPPFTQDLDWPGIMKALKETGYQGDLTFEIVLYMKRMPDALMPDALKFAHRIGEHLVSLYQQA